MITKVFKSSFSRTLLDWFNNEKRHLPFRNSKDPYKVWLSEIILQQTQMQTGIKYYMKFIKKFPSVNDLARSNQKDIYSLWEGLGYYNRAVNLHKTAKIINKKYKGVFPKTYDKLIKLPGIGKYTAAAVSSICYNEKRVVVDANVYRVLSRVFGIKINISKSSAFNSFLNLSNSLAKKTQNTGDYNEAIMDFGGTVCSPKTPKCNICIFNSECVAYDKNLIQTLPIKSIKKKSKKRNFNYYVFESKKALLIKKRTQKDIWKNLYEFYMEEGSSSSISRKRIEKKLKEKNIEPIVSTRKGVLSHQIINASFFHFNVLNLTLFEEIRKKLKLIKVEKKKINEYGFPKVITNYLNSKC